MQALNESLKHWTLLAKDQLCANDNGDIDEGDDKNNVPCAWKIDRSISSPFPEFRNEMIKKVSP